MPLGQVPFPLLCECLHSLAFSFQLLFVFVPCFGPVHFGIPGFLHQQFEMEYHQTSDCSLPFPGSQPIEFCDFWAFESFLSGLD